MRILVIRLWKRRRYCVPVAVLRRVRWVVQQSRQSFLLKSGIKLTIRGRIFLFLGCERGLHLNLNFKAFIHIQAVTSKLYAVVAWFN